MRRLFLLSAAVLALAACDRKADAPADKASTSTEAAPAGVVLDAAGLPKVRSGLWEVTSTEDRGKTTKVEKQCVGEEGTRELREILTRRDTPECKFTQGLKAGGFVVTAVCEQGGGVKSLLTVVWHGSETAFDMKMSVGAETPQGKIDAGEIRAKGQWTGPCPAGVKPGDEIE
ncbi:DUF3617 family protein [Caulobacter sp. 17J80-11]|uniref:DUF3617 domain-containing protein n=1 Tax=Caulobacter sp. 17J80-11 TaxID=2763502 RepID=UPI0016539DF5|nr:DUF3617 family protein [Caulobacter sp. 17J80-11]MBC6982332.1 hypothetical protein [Caulobacter sp. 17J80-11]